MRERTPVGMECFLPSLNHSDDQPMSATPVERLGLARNHIDDQPMSATPVERRGLARNRDGCVLPSVLNSSTTEGSSGIARAHEARGDSTNFRCGCTPDYTQCVSNCRNGASVNSCENVSGPFSTIVNWRLCHRDCETLLDRVTNLRGWRGRVSALVGTFRIG